MRLRTIVAIAPGGDLDAALDSPADAVCVTLTGEGEPVDGLRDAAASAIPRIFEAGKLALVTVNHPRTQLLRGDLEAVVLPGLSGVLLPHATDPQAVRDLAVLLREFEYTRGIEPGEVAAFPVVDTARGLLRAAELVEAAPRTAGLVFDSHAYARDVSARHEERGERLAYARGATVAAARAHDRLPLTTSSGLEVPWLAEQGFAGVVLEDARHAGAANAAFTPKEPALGRARRHVAAYDAARAEGAWVGRSQGEVVDSHEARKAQQVVEQGG